jgi:hypothetical protein
MTNITTSQIASTTAENLTLNHNDQFQTKFTYYDYTQGTKYKKTNCACFVGAAGVMGGFAVATLVDPATRNDILKGVGAGVASSMLYLWASVGSLKPITERGISHIQTQIRQTLHSNLIEKTNIRKNIEETTRKLQQIEPKAIEEHQELTSKAKQIFEAETVEYNEKFKELTTILGGYLAIRGLVTNIYHDDDTPANHNTTETPSSTNTQGLRGHSDDKQVYQYTRAAVSFCNFVNNGSNDWYSQIELLHNLRPCVSKSELIIIKSFLDICPEPPKLNKAIGPNEKKYTNLKFEKQNLTSKELTLKNKIETLQKNHGIEVNDEGKIIFPNLQEFAASLPK